MSNIDKRALREAAEKASTDNHTQDEWFHYLRCSTPETVLALLDELEKMQAQSSKWCEAFHKAVSVGARYEERIAELEAKLDSADKLQDSAFRHGLQHGFSLGQTDNQAGFEECLSAYGTGKGE
ncbi:TPA: ead/Ea22-like family protein [Enterobacter asburiae]